MRAAKQARVLTAIARVREAQEEVAKVSVAAAQLEVDRLVEVKQARASALEAEQNEWARVLESKLDPSITSAWAASVLRASGELEQAGDDLQAAEREKLTRTEHWRLSRARADATGEIATRVRRKLARQSEEVASADAADLFLQRRVQP